MSTTPKVEFFVQDFGQRQVMQVIFDCVPPDYVIHNFCNAIDHHPTESQFGIYRDCLTIRFYSDRFRGEVRQNNGRIALHRSGFIRFNNLFPTQDDADLCWACDTPYGVYDEALHKAAG